MFVLLVLFRSLFRTLVLQSANEESPDKSEQQCDDYDEADDGHHHDDGKGHGNHVDDVDCDMITEADGGDDNVDSLEFMILVYTSSSCLVGRANPRDCCILIAENRYTFHALAWWTGRILDTVAKASPKLSQSAAYSNQIALLGGGSPPGVSPGG